MFLLAGCGDDSSKSKEEEKVLLPENTSQSCQDGIDNDENGKTDCEDEGCKDFSFCSQPEEGKENTLVACQDGKDNDADGKIDCEDEDCLVFAVCQKKEPENTESACSDGIDNDGDGKIDCDDDDCKAFVFCQLPVTEKENTESACSDGVDNDGDGKIDCDDDDCKEFLHCKIPEENTVERCQDGIDNDKNGFIDCDDYQCQQFEHCKLALCQDKLDNDGDGKIDCEDPDCLSMEYCAAYRVVENTAELCSDGYDNDNNGKKDCDELSCKHLDVCMASGKSGENTYETCRDGIDNDGDGKIDCDDIECAEFEYCLGTKTDNVTKEQCKDGKDNDGDGLIDCADPDCQQFTDICKDLCPEDPYKYMADKCPCGQTWVPDEEAEEGGRCHINISTAEEFIDQLEKKINANFILMRSIDFGERAFFKPLREFQGILEGNGKRIDGVFHIDVGAYEGYVTELGLFGRIEVATFRNLVIGITLNVKNAHWWMHIGALGGQSNSSTYRNITGISKVYVTVEPSMDLEDFYCIDLNVGGLIGYSSGFDTIDGVYLQNSNTTMEIMDFSKEIKGDSQNATFEKVEKAISVGGLVGKVSSPQVFRNVQSFANVTFNTNMYFRFSGTGSKTFEPFVYNIGGIAGTASNLENVHSRGTISVKTHNCFDKTPTSIDGYTAVYIADAMLRIGGIVGVGDNISMSSFKGEIRDSSYEMSTYSRDELKAGDGRICIGGIVGETKSNETVYDGLYSDAQFFVDSLCSNAKWGKYHRYASLFMGGGVGCWMGGERSFFVNSYLKSQLYVQNIETCEKTHSLNWGGIASKYAPSDGNHGYIVNNHVRSEYMLNHWPKNTTFNSTSILRIGGVVSGLYGTIVNNFVLGKIIGESSNESVVYYKPFIKAVAGNKLYETYWNSDLFGMTPGSATVDGSAKMYTFNPAKIPVTSMGEQILGLLSSSSGHNGGVLSANIPKFGENNSSIYVDWKSILDSDGNQVPVPMSSVSNY